MKLRPFVFALLCSAALILAMCLFNAVMTARMKMHADTSSVLHLLEGILFDIAILWSRFWVLGVMLILGFRLQSQSL